MNLFASISVEQFRKRTATSKPPHVYKRKLCACGKQVTARQLTQYGRCQTCSRSTEKTGAI